MKHIMRMILFKHIIFLLSILTLKVSAQDIEKGFFRSPLNIPLYLSGNFGELRSNHYHSGIDIKTNGKVGYKVYATASGYVSRVKVSPYGYGKAIYISHPNGYTTVYAHLLSFSDRIDSLVRAFQYRYESFAIDENLPQGILQVKKGEVIALSGNSGSSGGPHLHYEIRETISEHILNPLHSGLNISDTIPPVFRSLFIYPLDKNATVDREKKRKQYMVIRDNQYSLAKQAYPLVSGNIGFAIDVRDYMNGTYNYYGIHKAQLYVDGVLQHEFVFDKFSFEESKYINAHIDYSLYKRRKMFISRLFHQDNHKESFANKITYGSSFGVGNHNVKIIVADAYGNESVLNFEIKAVPSNSFVQKRTPKFRYNETNYVEQAECFMEIPAFALYSNYDREVIVSKSALEKNSYSDDYSLLNEYIPLHKSMKVCIRSTKVPEELKSKAFIAHKTKKGIKFLGNTYDGEYLVGRAKEFGVFGILTDNIPPQISLCKKYSYKRTGKLCYIIKDKLSGIASYRGVIDDKWVPFEYDAKRDKLSYKLSPKDIEKGKKHYLVLIVTDNCGNKTIRRKSFYW